MSEQSGIDMNLDALLASVRDDDISPEHRAWMNEQIRQTLAKMEAGSITYHSLEDVMREFGLDAG